MDLPSVFTFFARLTHFSTTSTIWHQSDLDIMIVPDLTGLENATKELNLTVTEDAAEDVRHAPDAVRKAKSFGKAGAALNAPAGTNRATEVKKEDLQDRQSCASGSAFYACANGFRGCCSVDPCNPGATCPDGQSSSTAAGSTAATGATASQATAATTTEQPSSSAAESATTPVSIATASSTQDATPLLTASSTGSATMSASPSASSNVTASGSVPLVSPAPECPAANNTIYTDSSKIGYTIHCDADNSYSSSTTIEVSVGGYGECFSACSKSSACAGFTYVGVDSGSCYLKQQMPVNNYAAKSGSNYISCSKVDATAASPSVTPNGTGRPHGSNIGAIAGGVIGGIAFLALLLLLVALLAKRRRKKIEERRATVTYVHQGPMETQQASRADGHARTGSTAHDAFAPFGGFYRGFSSAVADRQADDDTEKAREAEGFASVGRAPSAVTEKSGMLLPATVYKRPSNPSADTVPMLDGTPMKRPLSLSSGSRSPRFHEHLAEMEDTSMRTPPKAARGPRLPRTPDSDSPTIGRESNISIRGVGGSLADEVRERQHLMSWNTYDPGQSGHSTREEEMSATVIPKTPPSAQSPDQVSPDLSNTPRDSNFVVSPFGSVDRRPR